MTYFLTYTALLVSTYLGRSNGQIRTVLYWVALVGLFAFVGYRFDVGCDFSTYQLHYEIGASRVVNEILSARDPGHWLLIYVLNLYDFEALSLNVVASATFFLGLHSLARRQPDALAFLVLCFPILIINMPMAATRQSMAIGFMCAAFVSFSDRKPVRFGFWTAIGGMFHSSALLFLLLVPFVRGRLNTRNILLGLLLAIPGALALTQSDSASLAETRYLTGGKEAAGAAFRLGILCLSGVFFFVSLERSWRKQYPYDYKIVVIGSSMMVGFMALFFVSSVIGDRFGYYLIPIQAIVFSRIPYLNIGRLRQINSLAPYAALTLVFIVWTSTSWHFNQCYTPYQTWIFGKPNIIN